MHKRRLACAAGENEYNLNKLGVEEAAGPLSKRSKDGLLGALAHVCVGVGDSADEAIEERPAELDVVFEHELSEKDDCVAAHLPPQTKGDEGSNECGKTTSARGSLTRGEGSAMEPAITGMYRSTSAVNRTQRSPSTNRMLFRTAAGVDERDCNQTGALII